MILDKLENLNCYCGISERLDKAFKFLSETDFNQLPEGRHDIEGDAVYALVQTYTTMNSAEVDFEVHRKYADIHYLRKGSETVYWALVEELQVKGEFSEQDDAGFFTGAEGIPVTLSEGRFVVLFPHDAHRPCCVSGKPEEVKKIVIKVLVQG